MKKEVSYQFLSSSYELSYEDYCEDCEDNGIEPDEEWSQAYWDWYSDLNSFYYESDRENVKYSGENDAPCIIVGTLRLWHGSNEIVPKLCKTLLEAIDCCCKGSIDEIKAMYVNGVVNVSAYHHDGTNTFTIHKLNKRGVERYNKGLEFNSENYDKYIKLYKPF